MPRPSKLKKEICFYCHAEKKLFILPLNLAKFFCIVAKIDQSTQIKLCRTCFDKVKHSHQRSMLKLRSKQVISSDTSSASLSSNNNSQHTVDLNKNPPSQTKTETTGSSYDVLNRLDKPTTTTSSSSSSENNTSTTGEKSNNSNLADDSIDRLVNNPPRSYQSNNSDHAHSVAAIPIFKVPENRRSRPTTSAAGAANDDDDDDVDDDDTFDPQVRLPTIQPLVKRRKFTDENAPIFRTDLIFGG